MHFCEQMPREEWSAEAIRLLHLSLNAPVVSIDELPVGPARAGIALFGDPDGAMHLAIAVRSLRTGQMVSYAPDEDIEGGREASRLAALLEEVNNGDAYRIAELGIGCNDRASICGITLEDEKVLGTCHIAVGSNALFGGTTVVDIHLDGVLTLPTIHFDEQKIIEDGCLLSG